jgi:uncharacterized membrane protein (DUF4010 family)
VATATNGSTLLLGLGLVAYVGAMTIFFREENRAQGSFSATTAVAGFVAFALGALAIVGDLRVVAAAAVAAAGILALRENMHRWVEQLTWPELRGALVLLAMSFLALPILPDEAFLDAVNPREVWIIAIALGAVSFTGYAAVKVFGERRGLLLAGAAGGVASSTAVTFNNARRAASGDGSPHLLAAGVSLANAVMFLRVGALVAALQPDLLDRLVLPLAAMLAASVLAAIAALILTRPDGAQPGGVRLSNPFSFRSVVVFALLLAVMLAAARVVAENFGGAGVTVAAGLAGLVDVDAITVSVARLVPHTVTPALGAQAIMAAVGADTLSKIALGAAIGRGRFAHLIGAMGLGCLAAGAAAFAVNGGFAFDG